MPKLTGRTVPLSLPRRWVADLLAVSAGIPLIPTERSWNVAALIEVKRDLASSPGWAALIVKAFALTAERNPVLRRCYVRLPWPHLWQADYSVAAVTVARDYDGEPAVFFFHLHAPERMSLEAIQNHLHEAKSAPIETVSSYRRVIRLSRWPKPLRRFVWLYGYHCCGRSRAKNFGTLGLSTTAGAGSRLTHLISPLAATLSYGPIQGDGTMAATLVFDHRVMDGVAAAEALVEIERTLHGEILDELTACGRTPAPAVSAWPEAHPTR